MESNELSIERLNMKLLSCVTQYDRRLSRGKYYNHYALGSYFEVVENIVGDVKNGKDLVLAIQERSLDRLRSALLRAIETPPLGVKLGTIFVASWGYEQTNVDFYQVVTVVGPWTIEVRQVSGIRTEKPLAMTGTVVPTVGSFIGAPERKRLSADCQFKDGCAHAVLWDGSPMRWSSYA